MGETIFVFENLLKLTALFAVVVRIVNVMPELAMAELFVRIEELQKFWDTV